MLPRTGMEILQEYAKIVTSLKPQIHGILGQYPEIKQKLLTNPYEAYTILASTYKATRNRGMQEFISVLEKSRLISQIKKQFDSEIQEPTSSFFETFLGISKRAIGYCKSPFFEDRIRVLDTYEVGPFSVQILECEGVPLEKFYKISVSLGDVLTPNLLKNLFLQHQSATHAEITLQTLETLINQKITNFQQYLATNFKELSSTEQKNLAIYATSQSLNLTKTMPLLLDDAVQEIYLDKPCTAYYLDHSIWGRCKSNLVPLESELSHIITRLRLESRRPLDERNPSLKTELKTKLFHVRAAIDIPPLAYEGAHLNIRKIRIRTLTLPELVMNGTISLSAAAFLILCMTLRINITISGEPSTGKTTLANAVNLLGPPYWRKISIEDALESISIDEADRHKVTFQVDPFDSIGKTQSTKSNEIIRLLHRSPDWVFLGEIQTAEHSSAMFHALSAGIRGVQTCHANSNEELLLRWKIHHDIPEVSFQSLGLLVHMVKEIDQGPIIRKIAQISEVQFESEKASLKPIFEWSKTSGQLEQKSPALNSKIISRACKYQRLKQLDIRKRFNLYQQTLASLVSNQVFNTRDVVEAFDRTYSVDRQSLSKITESQTKRKESEQSSTIFAH
jgi:Flp pilus assembly CpaF family ATPase